MAGGAAKPGTSPAAVSVPGVRRREKLAKPPRTGWGWPKERAKLETADVCQRADQIRSAGQGLYTNSTLFSAPSQRPVTLVRPA
jgi:hypothetical protein